MNVLVAGANGYTGRLIIQKLAADGGHHPYAMVRNAEQAELLKKLGAEQVIVADLEAQDLREAVNGCDAVIFAAGSGSKTGPEKTITVDQEGAKRLIAAAKAGGVRHFVMLSSIGAEHPYGAIKHYHEAKGKADRYLKESGLDYTIVRPGRLTHDAAKGTVEIQTHFENHEGRDIPRADVAHVLVASLDKPHVKNKTFEVLSGQVAIEEALQDVQ
ncbi:NAD dependent epimerase/dehydratase [Pullulanibacillus camelliae]|uniref:NAD dependent epimerase/dehydratase n=1 Tax=Pullulanibacillus camelliae TaxID=1707096 RepID=A0A8J2YID5_9BACL|nr:SDR family oxidoreductase [Pullulanibacillus camelliae]GGE44836.1 NAD dependent epimerase/dehydratase [Pullulanibacillus camelliae]